MDLRGKMVQYNGHNQYIVMVAGSRRITTRNWAHLRKLKFDVDETEEIMTPPSATRPDLEKTERLEASFSRKVRKICRAQQKPPRLCQPKCWHQHRVEDRDLKLHH